MPEEKSREKKKIVLSEKRKAVQPAEERTGNGQEGTRTSNLGSIDHP